MWLDELAPTAVSLPGGLILERDRSIETAELRPLSGREEDWLARNATLPSALAVTQLLGNCLVRLGSAAPTLDMVRRLLIGDRDYLMLELRRLTLGDEFQAVLACPKCGGKIDVTFFAGDIPVERCPQKTAVYELALRSTGKHSRTVRFRLPSGADQESVTGMPLPAAADALLQRCLIGKPSPLNGKERNKVIDAMARLSPQVELELDVSCPECSHAFVAPFDTTAFFLQEMRAGNRQLLGEFHALAFHYHWSETEILRLERGRRRAYLSLLHDELQRN